MNIKQKIFLALLVVYIARKFYQSLKSIEEYNECNYVNQ